MVINTNSHRQHLPRGEIAVRILASARELGLHTIALHTADDDAHASHAHESVALPSAASYADAGLLVALCRSHRVDLLHPGYGFLSESADLCARLQSEGVAFVGPGPEALRRTGDKLGARRLAEQCGVPTLPAVDLGNETTTGDSLDRLRAFVEDVGLPVMLKAVDGGGGRGIRLVRDDGGIEAGLRMARRESPSGRVFVEKAAVGGGGYRHVEVQILGDGLGNVRHFWERECSIQRRFQKVVEVAPSTIPDRGLVEAVIDAAVRMARAVRYASLGTWEFLVSTEESAFYFMEINPRLQVEHTVTEAICGVDLVRCQILLAMGESILNLVPSEVPTPTATAMQLRVTAEDPLHDFTASIGRIRRVVFPGGNGVRVDSHLRPGVTVSADFDALLAKVIVTGHDWTAVVAKAERALEDLVVEGVATNIALLQYIVRSEDLRRRAFDTQWLEQQLAPGTITSKRIISQQSKHANPTAFKTGSLPPSSDRPTQAADQMIRKGDRFNVEIEGGNLGPTGFKADGLSVTSVTRNDFPTSLALQLSTHTHGTSRGLEPNQQQSYILRLSKQQLDARQGLGPGQLNPSSSQSTGAANGGHQSLLVVCPVPGQLVEILVEDGDAVGEGDAIAIVRQMKMELEVRAHRSGVVRALFDHEEGEDISVGTVICSIVPGDREKL